MQKIIAWTHKCRVLPKRLLNERRRRYFNNLRDPLFLLYTNIYCWIHLKRWIFYYENWRTLLDIYSTVLSTKNPDIRIYENRVEFFGLYIYYFPFWIMYLPNTDEENEYLEFNVFNRNVSAERFFFRLTTSRNLVWCIFCTSTEAP